MTDVFDRIAARLETPPFSAFDLRQRLPRLATSAWPHLAECWRIRTKSEPKQRSYFYSTKPGHTPQKLNRTVRPIPKVGTEPIHRVLYEHLIHPLQRDDDGYYAEVLVRDPEKCDCEDGACVNPLHFFTRNQRTRQDRSPDNSMIQFHQETMDPDEIAELADLIEGWVATNGIPDSIKPLRERYGEDFTLQELEAAIQRLGPKFTHLLDTENESVDSTG